MGICCSDEVPVKAPEQSNEEEVVLKKDEEEEKEGDEIEIAEVEVVRQQTPIEAMSSLAAQLYQEQCRCAEATRVQAEAKAKEREISYQLFGMASKGGCALMLPPIMAYITSKDLANLPQVCKIWRVAIRNDFGQVMAGACLGLLTSRFKLSEQEVAHVENMSGQGMIDWGTKVYGTYNHKWDALADDIEFNPKENAVVTKGDPCKGWPKFAHGFYGGSTKNATRAFAMKGYKVVKKHKDGTLVFGRNAALILQHSKDDVRRGRGR